MAKWHGMIGFAVTEETAPGIWTEKIREREYSGDMNRNYRRLESRDQVNDDLAIANEVSIVADPFACQNFHAIRYLRYFGTAWKVTGVEVQFPRLNLTMGGIYHGSEETGTP